MKSKDTVSKVLLVAGIAVFGLSLMFGLAGGVSFAAPPAAPTPVTSLSDQSNVAPAVVRLVDRQVITQSKRFIPKALLNYPLLDAQYIIVQPASVNTATLNMQFSNDGVNWVNGPTLVSANAASGTDMQQYANFGLYTAITATVVNTQPVTITVIVLGK